MRSIQREGVMQDRTGRVHYQRSIYSRQLMNRSWSKIGHTWFDDWIAPAIRAGPGDGEHVIGEGVPEDEF